MEHTAQSSVEHPLVKINTDTLEEISELYGIGPKLADRVVKYRETQGYFREPKDLSEVEGISLSLAETLAPHIDWSFPPQPASANTINKRTWMD